MLLTKYNEQALDNIKTPDGKCKCCGRVLNLYKYRIAPSMVYLLNDMARITQRRISVGQSNPRQVDLSDIDRPYSIKAQTTKLRLHGLIAKVKEGKNQKRRTWIITKKGWVFLGGEPIWAQVIVFNNTVLGHTDELVTLSQVTGRADDYIAEPILEEDSRQLVDLEGEEVKKKAIELGLVKE